MLDPYSHPPQVIHQVNYVGMDGYYDTSSSTCATSIINEEYAAVKISDDYIAYVVKSGTASCKPTKVKIVKGSVYPRGYVKGVLSTVSYYTRPTTNTYTVYLYDRTTAATQTITTLSDLDQFALSDDFVCWGESAVGVTCHQMSDGVTQAIPDSQYRMTLFDAYSDEYDVDGGVGLSYGFDLSKNYLVLNKGVLNSSDLKIKKIDGSTSTWTMSDFAVVSSGETNEHSLISLDCRAVVIGKKTSKVTTDICLLAHDVNGLRTYVYNTNKATSTLVGSTSNYGIGGQTTPLHINFHRFLFSPFYDLVYGSALTVYDETGLLFSVTDADYLTSERVLPNYTRAVQGGIFVTKPIASLQFKLRDGDSYPSLGYLVLLDASGVVHGGY